MTNRPFLVLLLSAGLMVGSATAVRLVFWNQLQNREHVYIRDLTRVLARTLQTDLSDEMSSRILAQERLAKLIEGRTPLQKLGKSGETSYEAASRAMIRYMALGREEEA